MITILISMTHLAREGSLHGVTEFSTTVITILVSYIMEDRNWEYRIIAQFLRFLR